MGMALKQAGLLWHYFAVTLQDMGVCHKSIISAYTHNMSLSPPTVISHSKTGTEGQAHTRTDVSALTPC